MDNYLFTCNECGAFFFTEGEKQFYKEKNLYYPKRCKKCREKFREKRKEDNMKVLTKIQDSWKDDAKQESSAYFYNIEEVNKIINEKKHFIIGRKGSGKSAIAKYLCESEQEQFFSEKLSFKNFPFGKLYDLENTDFTEPNQYITIWKYIIYSYVCRIMIRNTNTDSTVRDKLEKLYGDPSSVNNLERLISNWTSKGFDLKVLGSGFGFKLGNKEDPTLSFIEKTTILEDFLIENCDECIYLIVFDELDEDYRDFSTEKEKEAYTCLVTSLFKAVQDVKSIFSEKGKKIMPVIFLRNDIYALINDSDKNKWNDYKIEMDWSRERIKKMLAHRLAVTFELSTYETNFDDVWKKIFSSQQVFMGNKQHRKMDIFSYIARSTQLRPRDFIHYIKKCADMAKERDEYPITAQTVKKVDNVFSEYLRQEIVDEIHPVLPEIEHVLSILSQIRKQTFSTKEFSEVYKEYIKRFSLQDVGYEHILLKLFDFSVIGNQPSMKGQAIFKYEKPYARFNYQENLMIHRGLFKALQIF